MELAPWLFGTNWQWPRIVRERLTRDDDEHEPQQNIYFKIVAFLTDASIVYHGKDIIETYKSVLPMDHLLADGASCGFRW